MLTRDQISKLVESWNDVLTKWNTVGTLFYNNLFEAAPDLRPLFKNNIESQSDKFSATISIILAKAYKGNSIVADVQHLAVRHNQYGVLPEHYSIVGHVLVKTIREIMGKRWNAELEHLWVLLYDNLSDAMIKSSCVNTNPRS